MGGILKNKAAIVLLLVALFKKREWGELILRILLPLVALDRLDAISNLSVVVLQNILDLYFKYFKLPEDVVNRILQVVLALQHFKSSLVNFAATILQGSSAIHHISNIDNFVHQTIEFQSILITSRCPLLLTLCDEVES
ncbi:hypothetical protein Tco_1104554 [Tanacetum coccineum]